jgi:hypothetical protein
MSAPLPRPADTVLPDPLQDRPASGADSSTRTGRLIGLVRKLIDYGRQLAVTLCQHATDADIKDATRRFGTLDIRQIIASIIRGLNRAIELEARLARRAAREPTAPAAATVPSVRAPRAARPAERSAEVADPRLARMPTPTEIAEQVRRRPIGAVIADICHDLGIVPAHPLWRELARAVMEHGGSFAALFRDACKRLCNRPPGFFAELAPAQPAPHPGPAIAPGTGPP